MKKIKDNFNEHDFSAANEDTWADLKFGKVCKCGVRHINIGTPGHNLPKSNYKCDERK